MGAGFSCLWLFRTKVDDWLTQPLAQHRNVFNRAGGRSGLHRGAALS